LVTFLYISFDYLLKIIGVVMMAKHDV